jgi:hypothetical protein
VFEKLRFGDGCMEGFLSLNNSDLDTDELERFFV